MIVKSEKDDMWVEPTLQSRLTHKQTIPPVGERQENRGQG